MRPLALLAVVLLAGCSWLGLDNDRPPKVDCSTAYGCSVGGPIPSTEQIQTAQQHVAAEMQLEIASGRLVLPRPVNWSDFPRVEFVQTPFWVERPDSNPNGTGGPPQCAKAMTTDKGRRIVVSTCIEKETLSLIAWETRNSFLWRGGRKDLAH